jgi:7-cyano-7-deazaguanine synthase
MSDVLVLFSGGLDSTTLLYEAVGAGRLGLAVWMRYPHPACAAEYRAQVAIRRDLELRGIKVRLMELSPPIFGTDTMHAGVGATGPRVLPGRNLLFLSLAVNIAAANGLAEVQFGASDADADNYPDCRPAFVESVDAMSRAWGVRVRAPLLGSSRADVLRRAGAAGVPLGLVWSCYEPREGAPCGECDSCTQDPMGGRHDPV